ncbi:hypothetical protein VNO77_15998 [Canavalia gladiata]|uniref:Uncharacterized protein n=1 Tax=Canavalia gladiata TaxID=3824 RepID=A0AAN9QRL7_CANGL
MMSWSITSKYPSRDVESHSRYSSTWGTRHAWHTLFNYANLFLCEERGVAGGIVWLIQTRPEYGKQHSREGGGPPLACMYAAAKYTFPMFSTKLIRRRPTCGHSKNEHCECTHAPGMEIAHASELGLYFRTHYNLPCFINLSMLDRRLWRLLPPPVPSKVMKGCERLPTMSRRRPKISEA